MFCLFLCPDVSLQAYGELAFNHIPRSYLIPEQYWLWRNHLLESGSPEDRKWVLKANIHRYAKLHVLLLQCHWCCGNIPPAAEAPAAAAAAR
jgi:hypothetical protein